MFGVMENHINGCKNVSCKKVYMRGYIGNAGQPTKCSDGAKINTQMDNALGEIKCQFTNSWLFWKIEYFYKIYYYII